jgi:hypothetical protein
MYNKYKNKTYTQGIQNEVSDTENESKIIITNNNDKNSSDAEQDKCLKTTFQSKSIFTKQNNNISFYQSTSKNSYKTLKNNKNLNSTSSDKNFITLKKPPEAQLKISGEEKFSYNYTSLDKNSTDKSKDKNNDYNNEKVNLNEQHLIQKYKKPKRTIQSYKRQFNMEKSDNFNVLSYRPEDYESEIKVIKNKDKQKKIQVFKKQDVDDIFFPSKRTHSPQINADAIQKYQTYTLKYQSFFGSFNSSKNSHIAKSTSKIKTNQLSDFNIDKLIEIGDKYASNNPVLPLGKFMNNSIIYRTKNNKNKIPLSYKPNYFNYSNYSNYSNNHSNNNNEVKTIYNFSSFNLKNKTEDEEELRENTFNIPKDKKRVTKKVISKNNLKNSKNYDDNKEQNNKISKSKKNLNLNMETEQTDKKLTSIKIKKWQIKKMSKSSIAQQNTSDYNDEKKPVQEIIPIKTKKRTFINLTRKENTENNNKLENNNNKRNNKPKNDLVERKLLTDDEGNYRNSNYPNQMDKISKMNNEQNKEIIINNNKKFKTNKIPSSIYYKSNKPKNYYGYDERHNLEDTINNHAYFESVHSKKKINNLSFDKVA